MRHRLTETLGVRWRPGRTGGWEIAGIADELVKEFSRRRNEIDDALAELEDAIGRRTTLDEVQNIVTNTRSPKKEVDPSDLVDGWWERARRLGLDPESLERCAGQTQAVTSELDRGTLFTALTSPEDGLCAGSSIFTRVRRPLGARQPASPVRVDGPQPLLLPAADFERLADEFLASDHVIELLPRTFLRPAGWLANRSSPPPRS